MPEPGHELRRSLNAFLAAQLDATLTERRARLSAHETAQDVLLGRLAAFGLLPLRLLLPVRWQGRSTALGYTDDLMFMVVGGDLTLLSLDGPVPVHTLADVGAALSAGLPVDAAQLGVQADDLLLDLDDQPDAAEYAFAYLTSGPTTFMAAYTPQGLSWRDQPQVSLDPAELAALSTHPHRHVDAFLTRLSPGT